MSQAKTDAQRDGAEAGAAAPAKKKGKGKILIFAAIPVLLLAGGGAAFMFAPAVHDMIAGHGEAGHEEAAAAAETAKNTASRPTFVELPEMTVTLPNDGRPRQMRIRLALELSKTGPDLPSTDVVTPKVYDALLTYLRTLRDGEIEGGMAMDRMRADLFRRLDLVLGGGNLKDVLITGLVVG